MASLTPIFTAGVHVPILGPNWTVPALKTGNYFASVGETLKGNFDFGDLAKGTFSIGGQLNFEQGFDSRISNQSVSLPLIVDFTSPAFQIPGAHFQVTYTPSYNFGGDLRNTPSQVVMVGMSFNIQ